MRSRSAARVKEYERMRGCSGQGGIDEERELGVSNSDTLFVKILEVFSARWWSTPFGGHGFDSSRRRHIYLPSRSVERHYKMGQWGTPAFSKGKVETIKRPIRRGSEFALRKLGTSYWNYNHVSRIVRLPAYELKHTIHSLFSLFKKKLYLAEGSR